jgi:hypothetical protein
LKRTELSVKETAMSRIVAARFDTFDEAQGAARELRSAMLVADEVDVIYVTPPGQHAHFPVGGDELADKGTRKSAMGAVAGAVVGGGAGAVVGAGVVAPVAGPLAGAAAAGVGAYIGALAGSLATTHDTTPEPAGTQPQRKALRSAGVLVAVCVDHVSEAEVIDRLRSHGGKDIEIADGVWHDGHWASFDPVSPPMLVNPEEEKASQA